LGEGLWHPAVTSQMRDPVATLRDMSKYRTHAGHLQPGYSIVPALVQTYVQSGRPIMRYLRTLTDVASARSLAVSRGSLVASPTEILERVLCSVRVLCTALAC
jgi:hypothetical protein